MQDNTISEIVVLFSGANYVAGDVRVKDLAGNGSGFVANFSVLSFMNGSIDG